MRSEHDLRPTRTGIPSVGPQAVPVALALGERHVGSVRRWLEGTLGWQPVEDDLDGPVPPSVRLVDVEVAPTVRSDGDLVVVVVSAEHRLGPVTRTLEARAIARVEPVVGG